jgi:acyl-coenzyme A synthetase/AMP-(fatty) acid ligase
MLEFITRHRLNFLAGGPVHVRQLLELAKDGELLLPEVAAFRVGSTLIHEELRKALTERLTPNLYINYSMSETGGLTLAGPELLRRVPGTVGLALRRVQIEIVDEEGRALPVGEPGRLRAKTPWMVRGYFDDPQETALAFRDGWFVSGDRAHFTVEGALVHHGRADDLMIYDGLNVSPAEIESVLLRHPAVVEAAAFGVRLEPHGDVPVAAVVLKAEVGGDELAEHCRAWIGIRAPQHVLVLPRLPRNAAGKVLTHELRRVFDALAQKRGQKRSS